MYEDELEIATNLARAITYLLEQLQKNPVRYPLLMKAFVSVEFGTKPSIRTKCKSCGHQSVISTLELCGGLQDALLDLEQAIYWLQLEGRIDDEEATVHGADSSGPR
jgi:hypothetical protein